MKLTDRIAEFIKEQRAKQGLSLSVLGLLAFNNTYSKAWLSKIENKKQSMSIDRLEKLLDALEYDIEFIKKPSKQYNNYENHRKKN